MDNESKNNNVVPYPNLNKVLLEKGTDLMMSKRYKEALALFDQLIELEENQVDALVGSVVCCIELGQLVEAKKRCKEILLLGIGDYFDILNIYLSILMQLEEYQEITDTIEAIYSEQKVPGTYAENFDQILSVAKKMISQVEVDHTESRSGIENNTLEKLNNHENPELQWSIIQQLNHRDDEEVIQVFKGFVEKKENDPVLKSFVLQMLHSKGCKDTVTVEKLGKTLQVNLKELQDVFQMAFPHNVITQLKEIIEQKNPTLFQQTTQLWWHYLLVIYPFIPNGKESKTWAAALHAAANELNGFQQDYEQIANTYGVEVDSVKTYCEKIIDMEKYSIKGMKF